jgi:hypothetical protein
VEAPTLNQPGTFVAISDAPTETLVAVDGPMVKEVAVSVSILGVFTDVPA